MYSPLVVLLLITVSASAMPDECFSDKIYKYDALKGAHFMSHCLVMAVLEESANPPDEMEFKFGPNYDCSYRELKELNEDESMVFIMTCLLQKTRKAGDPPHLSPKIVKGRIASTAKEIYADTGDVRDCSPEKLQAVTYEEAQKNISEYGHCIVVQILEDLTYPEDLEKIDF